jgi:nucleotide-binding universal stress UspA family protein
MYQHLLVPIDGTDLSTETVGRAVELACTLGARITFFHAQPNHAASLFGEAELVRVTAWSTTPRRRATCLKAESAARAKGVPCESVTWSATPASRSSKRRAALHLIFIAGLARPPQQPRNDARLADLKVLVNAGRAVLVRQPPTARVGRALGSSATSIGRSPRCCTPDAPDCAGAKRRQPA